jgi:MFS family permease
MKPEEQTPAAGDYRYGWYTAIVLMVAYTLSFLDRQILTLMVGPIKADLQITDTQFAMLTGGAFALFYTVMALPMGWLADRYPRKWVIASGIAVWTMATGACAFARTFPGLMAARIMVGVGEATLSPSAYSMLRDRFDDSRLPRAMSIYSLGIFIGAGLALIIGGMVVSALEVTPYVDIPLLGTFRSWHAVFLVVGPPGIVVALWVATLREPERKKPLNAEEKKSLSFAEIARFLSAWPRMSVALFLGAGMLSILSYLDAWYPELFIRMYGWHADEAGRVNGLASLTAGPAGMVFAGWYTSRLIKRGRSDACLSLAMFGAIGLGIFGALMPIMPNATMMAVLIWPIKFMGGFNPVLIPAAIQMVAPHNLRAQLGAVFLLTTGILGTALGPIVPAFMSDYLIQDESKLNVSIAITALVVAPITAALIAYGRRQFRDRIASMPR